MSTLLQQLADRWRHWWYRVAGAPEPQLHSDPTQDRSGIPAKFDPRYPAS